jgi:hypothetical protein
MSARTVAAIEADLALFRGLRTTAATNGGRAEYSLDSGQGRMSVRMASPGQLTQTIRDLEAELVEAGNSGGAVTMSWGR